MNTTNIRLAEESDLGALCDLYFEFHEFHAHHLPNYLRSLDNASATDREELSNKIIEIIHANDSAILVADCLGQVKGFAEVYLKPLDPTNLAIAPMLYASLQSLSVTQDFRRLGIGKQLPKTAEAWAYNHGAVELRLDIWEFSAGPLGFYEKSGYHNIRHTLVKNL